MHHVDLYQLRLSEADLGRGAELRYQREEFVCEGLIRACARSADDPARAAVSAEGEQGTAVRAEQSAGAMAKGPLSSGQVAEADHVLGR